MNIINIACASGAATHAKDFSRRIASYPECRLTAIWDEDAKRGTDWAGEMGCRYVADYSELLADHTISGIVIASELPAHANLILRAVNAGKHVFVENGLTMTNEEAFAVCAAVKETGVKFVLSDPVMKPPFRYAKDLVDRGVLGSLTSARVRIAGDRRHAPEPNAFMPAELNGMPYSEGLGHHAICMLQWFLGEPVGVTAMSTAVSPEAERAGAKDNSAAIFTFQSGALGIAETGSLCVGWPYEVQLYGTKGCARITKGLMQYHLEEGDWITVPECEWPEAYPYILHDWVLSIRNDTPIQRYGIDEAVIHTRMYTAAGEALKYHVTV